MHFSAPGDGRLGYDPARPAEVLRQEAKSVGHANILFDPDGIVRKTNLCFRDGSNANRWPHISEYIYRGGGDTKSPAFAADASGSGPFKMARFVPRERLEVVANKTYWDPKRVPKLDRVVMLLVGAKNLREISLFPMNQRAEDLLMGAPSPAEPRSLRELHLRVVEPPKKEGA